MACAVGLEVFHILLEKDLSGNAARVGKVLKKGLEGLAETYDIIGQVRGIGLLLGVELVRDRETREPFPAEKNVNLLVTDEAYDEGLIIYPRKSINGLRGSHFLVAPPLIINEAQCKDVLNRLDRAFARTMKKLSSC